MRDSRARVRVEFISAGHKVVLAVYATIVFVDAEESACGAKCDATCKVVRVVARATEGHPLVQRCRGARFVGRRCFRHFLQSTQVSARFTRLGRILARFRSIGLA